MIMQPSADDNLTDDKRPEAQKISKYPQFLHYE